ncbi:MAG TPA: TetR/AcrR family transcriptional regulator [Advenella sp.]|nr:TetR/AcrR family transcriptional regulator [Advenella sp.]
MKTDFEHFKHELSLTKAEICRQLYVQHTDMIRIKKEHVAVRNLIRIIDSTLRLASTKGFHAMTLRDLCADSGFSIGGLYAYIRNKNDLLVLIQGHGFMLTRSTLRQSIRDVSAPFERLRAAVSAHLFLSEIMLPWFYFSFMEVKSLPKAEMKMAIAVEQEIEDIFFDIIEQGVRQGVFKTDNARLLASMIKAMMQDWYLKRRKHRNQSITVSQYADFMIDMLACSLKVSRS